MTKLTGTCLCGDLTYAAEGDIAMQVNCHCTDCRQSSGAAFATLVFLKDEDVRISGDIKAFDHDVDSGSILTKHFCPRCGSQMFTSNKSRPGMLGIRAGTIHEQEHVKPQFNVYTSSKMDCTALDVSIPAFETMPA